MGNDDSWTPEEIARASERQREVSEAAERKKALLKTKETKEKLQNDQKQIIVKTYKGNQARATQLFRADAAKMSALGYVPTSQSWAPGSYGCGSFLLALLLCFIIVGFLVFIYMLLVKPEGTLSVTYELRISNTASKSLPSSEEKTCPKCAEQVKIAAQVCRFCGYNFA